jgi:hypothetical protein
MVMKFNLTNRPRWSDYADTANEMQFIHKNQEWFEGFEKELRKKLMDLPYDKNTHERGVEQIIKQILGEQKE